MNGRQSKNSPEINNFDYDAAFSINYGLLSPEDQYKLRKTTVTVIGMSAGGVMAVMLSRAGVEKFILIDHDKYQMSDMNRDIGCFMDTLGEYKADIIKLQILRINPEAKVEIVTKKITLDELNPYLDRCDVFLSQCDDLAFSVHSVLLAQSKRKLVVTFMPSGMTGYIEIYPPDLNRVIDPAVLFGSPANLSYRQLYYFLRNPLNRCGRRWHITEGKWRIDWFEKWRDGKAEEAQLCPNIWLGAALACTEVIKYVTDKWQKVKVPKMWHVMTVDNCIKVEKYRRRSWWFEKFIFWTFSIELLSIGRKYHKYTARRLMRELGYMAKQEADGKEIKPPLIWRLI
jgi:hypothetical protein